VATVIMLSVMQELYRWESVAEAGRRALGLRYQASPKVTSCAMLASCWRCACRCTAWLDAPFDSGVHLQLLPYLYSAFHEAHRTGLPVARPLFFAAPADPQARNAEEQWLLGDAVLVSPVLRQGATEVRCHSAPFACLCPSMATLGMLHRFHPSSPSI
jgi:Glycosyl hydrolases family 31